MPKNQHSNKSFMIFTNVENHFYHHLLPIAQEAKNRGYNVYILTNFQNLEEQVRALGFATIDMKFSRKSLNPLNAAKEIYQIYKILKKIRPDYLMTFTIKPILFSTLATICLRSIKLFNNFVGLGLLFTDPHPKYKFLKFIVANTMRIAALGRKITYITQNKDDKLDLISSGISSSKNTISQCSVGVDLNYFKDSPLPKSKTICFALISRMLEDKGVKEFIDAAYILNKQGINARFILVGAPDDENPKSLTEHFLQNLNKEKIVEYLGQKSDVREVWKMAHVAVLPSYREGQSRVLLEAGAIGRAIITTNAPGGRDLINHNEDGLLVNVRDSKDLALAMNKLISKPDLIKSFSSRIQKKVKSEYSDQLIAVSILDIFDILNKKSKS